MIRHVPPATPMPSFPRSAGLRLVAGWALLSALFTASLPCRAADMTPGKSLEERQVEAARFFFLYDFESHSDPLLNRDRDGDLFPDYWEPVRGEGYPDYAWIRARIVDDPWRPGLRPGVSGRVLSMPFTGETVAWRTRIPRVIDPKLAYEISGYIRAENLDGGRAGIDIVWLHIDEHGREEILGAPERIIAPPGQVDWTEAPLLRRVNELNPRTNRVRFVCWVEDDPEIPAADRHAHVWFDDIRIDSRPKIQFSGNFRDDAEPIMLTLTYQGLVENVPESDAVQGSRKEYHRRIDIRDIDNHPVESRIEPWTRLDPGLSISAVELLSPPLPRYGVYYVTVTLFGRNREPQASVQQVIGRMKPPRSAGQGRERRERRILDRYAVGFDPQGWMSVDQKKLHYLFDLTGICRASLDVWPDYAPARRGETVNHQEVVRMLRGLRARDLRFTAVLAHPPAELTPAGETMLDIMAGRTEPLRKYLQAVTTEYAPQIDGWQWGADTAPGFDAAFDPATVTGARESLRNMANAFVQTLPVTLRTARQLPDPRASEAVNLLLDARMGETDLLNRVAELLPYYFARLDAPEPPVYPSREILSLITRHAGTVDLRRTETQEIIRRQHWLTIEPSPVDPHLRDREAERTHLIGIARKAVVGRALGFDRISVGPLADPERGLAGVTRTGEIVPRPALLAVRTLTDYLADAEYIGSFQLGSDVPNYVFRRQGRAVMVLWHTGAAHYATVEIGQGGDMRHVDIFGNAAPIARDTRITVNDLPTLVDNISLPWAMTRMSIRIDPLPNLDSVSRMQPQQLTIRNFFPDPLDGKIRILYALAIGPDGDRQLERGWLTQPAEIPVFLPGMSGPGQKVEFKFPFDVRPPQAAVLGEKLVRLQARLSAGGVFNFNLDRHTALASDIRAEYRVVVSPDVGVRHLRLLGTWRPEAGENAPPFLRMQPYYQIEGEPASVEGEVEIRAGEPFVRELRVPLPPRRNKRVWIGLEEDGGLRFLRLEIPRKDLYE